ncbi:MAG: short-chain dehydrogenase, partial [Acidobacteriota bacterium]|nr:short-chain dehydrogenase [Acidobacteriota bacterium]
RGPRVIVPEDATDKKVTPERLEAWVHDGWVDLRESNCARWIERFDAIHLELQAVPTSDSSSRFLRNHRFWHEDKGIQPGKVAGWILSAEEHGERFKH